jgi:hypothetical protein
MKEKRFTLRMDSVLFKEVSFIAKEHKRSIAKEIEYALSLYVKSILDEFGHNAEG